MHISVPARLIATCTGHGDRERWLAHLPQLVRRFVDEWALRLEAPFDGPEGSCAWVAPALRLDGRTAVLKLGMPHMEGDHEIRALRFWDGEPTVRMLEADESRHAMLLERCEPGAPLRTLPEDRQDVIVADLLRRLWRTPARGQFRTLASMLEKWSDETLAESARWPDAGLVEDGLQLFKELSAPRADDVLLATDLHAGNVLSARREPWLAIDPKPFVGDRAYDATQHLIDCQDRLMSAPGRVIREFSDMLEIDHERVRLWLFARAAAESRDVWDEASLALARRLGKADA